MQTPDLSPLIKGVFVIMAATIALGQYSGLEKWARTQALEAVAWKEPLPYFFGNGSTRVHHKIAAHRPYHKYSVDALAR